MNEYITSPDYKSSKKIRGICYGFQHYVDGAAPNNYTVGFHFPDKKVGLSAKGYEQGVPDQSKPVWLPYIAAPNLYAFEHYVHNGLLFMSNVVSW